MTDLALSIQDELTSAKDLDRAAEVQRGLSPKQLIDVSGYEVAGTCSPAHAVGGDFYDWYAVSGGAVFTLADVMGKGIGSAIIAATVRAVLRAESRVGAVGKSVSSAAATLDEDLSGTGTFVTLFHARLNKETGELRYIDAGHGLTLLVHADGRTDRLATTSFPLGVEINESWEEKSVILKPGDTLIAMSDGVLDIFDGTLTILDEIAALVRTSATAQAIVDEIAALAPRAFASDDVTALVLRRLA